MSEVVAMFEHRPDVVAVTVAFLVLATAERGWLRTGCWLVTGTAIGWLMEFSSTRSGFPFGHYAYHAELFPDEAWMGGVPLFASLSFAALSYFAFSAAYTMLSPLQNTGSGMQRVEQPRIARSFAALVLAATLATWMDMVIDPVTHLGRYWALGDLYHYAPGGSHFDVPLSNYAGWFVTVLSIVAVNQLIDRALPQPVPQHRLPYKPLLAIACLLGVYVYMIGVTVYLIASDGVPEAVPLGGILASGLGLTLVFLGFVAVMLRRARARWVPAT